MEHVNNKVVQETSPWFKNWFDSPHYHQLYANRDEGEAQQFIDALLGALQPARNASMIDVGCGAGRHAKYLSSKGYTVTGIDTAGSSIQQAKRFQSPSLCFHQHDMRVPFGKSSYDYVFNFFTSFGYFEGLHENYTVVQNMADAIKQKGTIVIDYLNVGYAEERLVAEESKQISGIIYYIKRWADNTHFYKKIIIDDQFSQPFEYVEKVAKFTISDFRYMFYCYDLRLVEIYGDYQLSPYSIINSPRLIMIVKKS